MRPGRSRGSLSALQFELTAGGPSRVEERLFEVAKRPAGDLAVMSRGLGMHRQGDRQEERYEKECGEDHGEPFIGYLHLRHVRSVGRGVLTGR